MSVPDKEPRVVKGAARQALALVAKVVEKTNYGELFANVLAFFRGLELLQKVLTQQPADLLLRLVECLQSHVLLDHRDRESTRGAGRPGTNDEGDVCS